MLICFVIHWISLRAGNVARHLLRVMVMTRRDMNRHRSLSVKLLLMCIPLLNMHITLLMMEVISLETLWST